MGKNNRDKSKIRIDKEVANEVSAFLFNLGNQFVRVNNAEAASDCFKYSLDLRPEQQPAVYNLACLYNVQGNREAAYRMFKEAARMDPTHLQSKVAMAEVARKMGNLKEADELITFVLNRDTQNLPATSARAILYYDLGRLAEASEWNERAMSLNSGDTHLMLNKALINMTYGRWPEWWSVYEQCLSYGKHNSRMKHLNRADSWQGDVKEGKTLLVVSDQGAGDAIQFGRFLKEAKEIGKFGKLIYLTQVDVAPLAAKFPGVDEVSGLGEREKLGRDEFISLLGIMRVLRISPENCRRDFILRPDQDLYEVWRARIGREWDGRSKKVALVWGGDPVHGNDPNRSIPLAKFMPLTKVEGVQIFSFQVGKASNQLAPVDGSIVEFGSMFRNYDDTLAALRNVDLLISVDTSILHLAGCADVPAWGLISNPPEWRWGLSGVRPGWYDSVELFRQSTPQDWGPVIDGVYRRLSEFGKLEAAA